MLYAALLACALLLATVAASAAEASASTASPPHARAGARGQSVAQRPRLARSRTRRRSHHAHRLTLRGPWPVAPHALWVGVRVALLDGVSPAVLALLGFAPPGAESPDRRIAPALTAKGTTLTWTAVPGVGAYEVLIRVPGQPDRLSSVTATSLTPPPVPGATVSYSVRTAVEGSEWAPAVAIAYPAFQPGMNSGWIYQGQLDTQAVTTLKAKVVRVNFPIAWTAAQLRATIAGYAALGVRVAPLASFDGRIPSSAEARNLASWAKAYGPEGTFWAGRADGELAVQTIEFGNETSGGYQYGDSAGTPSYMARARAYATLIKEAAEAISAAGSRVGMLAVSEDWTGDWMKEMFAAVPNLGTYVAGWVSHPYGTEWKKKIEYIVSQAAEHGAPPSILVDVTEWGVSSDNGRCVSDNYGYNPCMTYQEASETLRSAAAGIHNLLGERLGLFLFYQARDQKVSGTSSEREGYFGLLQHELQLKGAYTTAAQEVLAG